MVHNRHARTALGQPTKETDNLIDMSSACLVLAHFSHPSMAVVYHVTDHVANKTILRLPSHGKGGIFDRLERFPNYL